MRLITTFAIAAVVLGTISSGVASPAGRGGMSGMRVGPPNMAQPMPTAVPRPAPPVAQPMPLPMVPTSPAMNPLSSTPVLAVPNGAPITGTVPLLPGGDSVANCVHNAGVAGYAGTGEAGPYVHSCAFGQ